MLNPGYPWKTQGTGDTRLELPARHLTYRPVKRSPTHASLCASAGQQTPNLTGLTTMRSLDGTACSQQIRQEIALEVEAIVAAGKRPPHLAAVLVGDDGASQNYVGMKVRDCEEVGFGSTTVRMKASTTEAELLAKIDELNSNDA